MNWYLQASAPIQQDIIEEALAYQLTLTKPPGALGALEDVAVKLAGLHAFILVFLQAITALPNKGCRHSLRRSPQKW